jgi:hypothetical protein
MRLPPEQPSDEGAEADLRPRTDGEVGGSSTDSRYHLRENVSRADEELAARIADAPAPFWRIVRDAIKTEQAM